VNPFEELEPGHYRLVVDRTPTAVMFLDASPDHHEFLAGVLERALPVTINRGHYVGMCDCGNPFAGMPCQCPHPYVEIQTVEAFEAYYDGASDEAKGYLWEWVLKSIEKHGSEVIADMEV